MGESIDQENIKARIIANGSTFEFYETINFLKLIDHRNKLINSYKAFKNEDDRTNIIFEIKRVNILIKNYLKI